jgi:hypothetical protein
MTDPLSISIFLTFVALSVVFLLWVLWRVELDIRRTRARSKPCPEPVTPGIDPPRPAPRREAPLASWPSAGSARTLPR